MRARVCVRMYVCMSDGPWGPSGDGLIGTDLTRTHKPTENTVKPTRITCTPDSTNRSVDGAIGPTTVNHSPFEWALRPHSDCAGCHHFDNRTTAAAAAAATANRPTTQPPTTALTTTTPDLHDQREARERATTDAIVGGTSSACLLRWPPWRWRA